MPQRENFLAGRKFVQGTILLPEDSHLMLFQMPYSIQNINRGQIKDTVSRKDISSGTVRWVIWEICFQL